MDKLCRTAWTLWVKLRLAKTSGSGCQPSGFVRTTTNLRMRHRSTLSTGTFMLCIGWRSGVCRGSCAFRFAAYPNISELPVWTLPASPPRGPETWTAGAANPIVYLANDGTEETVDCTGDAWQYQAANGAWKTEVSFPTNGADDSDPSSATFEGFLNATGDGGITVSGIPASIATAVSDSLYGRPIRLNLTCNQGSPVVEEEESCVLFKVDFTNFSPAFNVNMALYRFKDPALPGIEMPLAQPFSPGDVRLNEGNAIVELDRSEVDWGCNGDVAEYQGEDGEWYYWFTGSDGQSYNLTHVFYATDFDHLNIATIQEVWSPNLEAALQNRYVRLFIQCNNQDALEEGYLLFKIGASDESCQDHPGLCVGEGLGDDDDDDDDENGACDHAFRLGWALVVLSSAVVAVLTVHESL